MDENFETKLTNLGVCYTFNSPLEVTESGKYNTQYFLFWLVETQGGLVCL